MTAQEIEDSATIRLIVRMMVFVACLAVTTTTGFVGWWGSGIVTTVNETANTVQRIMSNQTYIINRLSALEAMNDDRYRKSDALEDFRNVYAITNDHEQRIRVNERAIFSK